MTTEFQVNKEISIYQIVGIAALLAAALSFMVGKYVGNENRLQQLEMRMSQQQDHDSNQGQLIEKYYLEQRAAINQLREEVEAIQLRQAALNNRIWMVGQDEKP